MEISNIPALLRRAFAAAGDKASIPLTSVSASRASFDVGFPALNMTPLSSGGVPPDGRDMNGILYAISQAALWAQAMGVMPWDTAFASAEGYPNGALVQHSGAIWRSKANNNAVAPSAASVAWERVSAEGGTTGQALVKASNKNGDWSWKALAISDIQGLQATIDNNKVTFSAAAPAMDGTATPGTSAAAARADHVHPTDTTRAAAVHGHAIEDVSGLQAELDGKMPADAVVAPPRGMQVFTASGTFTVPTGVTSVKVRGCGGGGGHGTTANGGTTSFGSYCSATGGLSTATTTMGGGTATGGDLNIDGGRGAYFPGGTSFSGGAVGGANGGYTKALDTSLPMSSGILGIYGCGVSGGAGGYFEKYITGLTPGQSIPVTIGAAGWGAGAGICIVEW